MKGNHIVLAGGSGFIGRAMAARWAQDNRVTILTRGQQGADNSFGHSQAIPGVELVLWDGRTTGPWVQALEGCDILMNLAGRTVNCRYNETNKRAILQSRVDATQALGAAIKMLNKPPELFINAASATIYRHAEDQPQDEYTGEMEQDFSVQVCMAWERAFAGLNLAHTRKVILRMAIVLGNGGVLVPYSRLARLGLGGRHGTGRQMFSWIHIDDLCSIAEWLNENKDQKGIYNAAAPGPLPNHQFMKLLRKQYQRQVGIPSPAWLLEIAAFIHGTETELLLKSRWVVPARLLKAGFAFQYSDVEAALRDLLQPALQQVNDLSAVKIADLVIQLGLPISCAVFLPTPFPGYFLLCGLQVASGIINKLLLPAAYRVKARSVYEAWLLILAIGATSLLFVPPDGLRGLPLAYLIILVISSPALIILYLTITILEIRKASEAKEALEKRLTCN